MGANYHLFRLGGLHGIFFGIVLKSMGTHSLGFIDVAHKLFT